MHNHDVKNRFIEELSDKESVRSLAAHIFSTTEPFEDALGIDFCRMNLEQAQKTVNSTVGLRISNARSILYVLREYVKWCAAQGMEVSTAVENVDLALEEQMRMRMVGSPAQLEFTLKEVYNEPDKNSIQYIHRAFLWLAFIGLQDFEAMQVRTSDLNYEDMYLRFGGGDPFRIYSEAVPDLKMAKRLDSFNETRRGNTKEFPRAKGDLLLRGKPTENSPQQVLVHTFRPTISRAFKAALERCEAEGKIPAGVMFHLSYDRLYRSGVFYRAFERERMQLPLGFDATVAREMQLRPGGKKLEKSAARKVAQGKIREYLIEYEQWKKAFT